MNGYVHYNTYKNICVYNNITHFQYFEQYMKRSGDADLVNTLQYFEMVTKEVLTQALTSDHYYDKVEEDLIDIANWLCDEFNVTNAPQDSFPIDDRYLKAYKILYTLNTNTSYEIFNQQVADEVITPLINMMVENDKLIRVNNQKAVINVPYLMTISVTDYSNVNYTEQAELYGLVSTLLLYWVVDKLNIVPQNMQLSYYD